MAIENINAYSERWQNGVSVGAMWDKIKAKFVSGHHDQTAYPADWKKQARTNIGLTTPASGINYSNGEGFLWYGSSDTAVSTVLVTQYAREEILCAEEDTRVSGLFATKAYRLAQSSVGSASLPIYVDTNGRVATISSLAVSGNVQSLQGGVSAMGIADLFSSVGVGGGGGTVTGVDFTQDVAYQQTGSYTPDDGIIHLPRYKWANIQDKPIVTTGSVNGTISYGGNNVAVYGLQALAYKASLTASDIPTIAISQVSGLQTALNNKLETSLKGAANGLAELDASQKIKLAQIPDVVLGQLVFGGTVKASGEATLSANAKTKTGITSDTVTLSNSAGTSSSYGWVRFEGCFFIMDADSSFASLDLKVGDWLLSTGTAWKKVDNTDAVTGVKGDNESSYRIGNVNITKANIGLGNVENTALSTWAGTQNITTLGTITTGVWHGTKIANDYLVNSTIYINGTLFTLGDSATQDKVTAVWGASRDITISDNDGTNTQVTEDVSGANNFTLKLPSTIKATLTGNASSATKLQTSRNIWGQPFNGTAEVSGNMSSVGNIAFNDGDHNIGSLLYFDMTNGRIGIGMSAPLEKLGVQGNMYATGGVAAYGISDLSQSGGGGGGLSGTILRDWSQYDGSAEANQILSSYLGIEQFRMSGQNFQFMRNKTWTTGFTLAEGNIPDLAIGKITGVQSLTIKGGTTSIGTYLPSSALEVSIVAGTNISVTPDATNHTITIANTYSLPTASSSTKGGVKVGSGLTISNEVLSVSGVTNDMLSGSIANSKLASLGKFTIGSQAIELGQTYTQANFRTYLGLGTAATHAHGDYVTDLGVSDDTLTWSKGGTAQSALTLNYAKTTSRFKSESKPDQEFVYRQSPQTIDADSLVINKFKGRTVVWNQLCDRNSAASGSGNGLTWTYDATKKSIKIVGTATGDQNIQISYHQSDKLIKGHKYYVGGLPSYSGGWSTSWCFRNGNTAFLVAVANSGIINYTNDDADTNFAIRIANGTQVDFTINPIVVDLTLMFGETVANSMTVEKFEALYLPKYYSYNQGRLINNAADGLETVGFNLWDEEWINGYVGNNGELIYGSGHAVTNLIPVIGGNSYYWKEGYHPTTGYLIGYDNSLNYLGLLANISTSASFTMPQNCSYVRIQYNGSFNTVINYKFNLNLSDPNRNGQYEPYKRNVLDLHLDNIQVKSHNIWDEEWEVGIYNTSTGQKDTSVANIRSKNPIPVVPNTKYYFGGTTNTGSAGALYGRIFFYDANGTFLSQVDSPNREFTIPANCRYINFHIGSGYGATYNNDICINESSSFNGQYEPHGILTINGLKEAVSSTRGSVRDEIVGNKLIKRIETKRLSSQDVSKALSSYTNVDYAAFAKPSNYASWISYRVNPLTHSKYGIATEYVTGWDNAGNVGRVLPGGNSTVVWIGYAKNTSESTMKSDLDGTEFNYELATPIEYELASPIPDTMPAGTTERIISDRLPVTPFACDMTYGANPKDILASGIAWEKIWGRPQLAKGSYTDSVISGSGEWFKLDVGGQVLYVQFAVGTGAFRLKIADSDDEDAATVSKEFAFATLSTDDIDRICV